MKRGLLCLLAVDDWEMVILFGWAFCTGIELRIISHGLPPLRGPRF